MNKTVMIVEDDARIRYLIKIYLNNEGYNIIEAEDGNEALKKFNDSVDLVILDIMMPYVNGYEVCRIIRETSNVLIIMITAKGEEDDKLLGYELGADDYVTKPFSPKVLTAKINVLMKRLKASNPLVKTEGIIKFADIEINKLSHDVYIKNEKVYLSPREFDLLLYMTINSGLVLTRDTIVDNVWGCDFDGDIRTVDSHIKRIRQKLKESKTLITTIKRSGYKFEVIE